MKSGQHDLHVGDVVAVEIGLDDGVPGGLVLEPCHAVGDNILILAAIQEGLVSGDCTV